MHSAIAIPRPSLGTGPVRQLLRRALLLQPRAITLPISATVIQPVHLLHLHQLEERGLDGLLVGIIHVRLGAEPVEQRVLGRARRRRGARAAPVRDARRAADGGVGDGRVAEPASLDFDAATAKGVARAGEGPGGGPAEPAPAVAALLLELALPLLGGRPRAAAQLVVGHALAAERVAAAEEALAGEALGGEGLPFMAQLAPQGVELVVVRAEPVVAQPVVVSSVIKRGSWTYSWSMVSRACSRGRNERLLDG